MDYNNDSNSAVNQLQTVLSNGLNCTSTLAGLGVNDTINSIKRMKIDPATNLPVLDIEMFRVREPLAQSSLIIDTMTIVTLPDGSDALRVNFTAGKIDGVNLIKKKLIGSDQQSKYFRLSGAKDVTGKFTSCFSDTGEIIKQLVADLPACVILDGAASCSGIYQYQTDQMKSDIKVYGRQICTTVYEGQGTAPCSSPNKYFERDCYCGGASGVACNCSNGPAPGCFTVFSNRCNDAPEISEIISKKCCKAPNRIGCFVAGTQIEMFSGELKNIEDVAVGDELVDGSKSKVISRKLIRYPYQGPIYSINGSGYFFTPTHPFKSLGGWKSLDPTTSEKESGVKVTLLQVGDVLIKSNGLELIHSLDSEYREEYVYNFNVSDTQEYIADGYLVHNKVAPFVQRLVATPTPPRTTCFVAGTQIEMFSGEFKNIEDVVVGDELVDGNKKKVLTQKLLKSPYKGQIFSINGGGYFFTPAHPFKSLDGWKSLAPELSTKESGVPVSRLALGDILVKSDGLELIHSLDSVYREEDVYNFNVSDSSEYVADGYVVHNKLSTFNPPVFIPAPAPACFVAGTQIEMFDGGLRNIEDVRVGDELIDGRKNKVIARKLLRQGYKGEIYSINGGGYFFTPVHPFKSLDGWKSMSPKTSEKESGIKVSKLRVGDVLLKSSGVELVLSLDSVYREEVVYNFNVSDTQEYVADGYQVHNKQEVIDPLMIAP